MQEERWNCPSDGGHVGCMHVGHVSSNTPSKKREFFIDGHSLTFIRSFPSLFEHVKVAHGLSLADVPAHAACPKEGRSLFDSMKRPFSIGLVPFYYYYCVCVIITTNERFLFIAHLAALPAGICSYMYIKTRWRWTLVSASRRHATFAPLRFVPVDFEPDHEASHSPPSIAP